jgi:flagellar hook-length control protein FliK
MISPVRTEAGLWAIVEVWSDFRDAFTAHAIPSKGKNSLLLPNEVISDEKNLLEKNQPPENLAGWKTLKFQIPKEASLSAQNGNRSEKELSPEKLPEPSEDGRDGVSSAKNAEVKNARLSLTDLPLGSQRRISTDSPASEVAPEMAQPPASGGSTDKPLLNLSEDPLLREALARAGMNLSSQSPKLSRNEVRRRDSEAEVKNQNIEGEAEGTLSGSRLGIKPGSDTLNGEKGFGSGERQASPESTSSEIGDLRNTSKESATETTSDKKAPPPPVRMPFLHTVLAKEIAARTVTLAMNGREELRLRLDPPHLGRMQVEIEMKNGRLSARIGVEHEAARQQVEQQLSSLREALEAQGLKPHSLEVNVQERDAGWTQGFAQEAGGKRRGESEENENEEVDIVSPGRKDTGRRFGFNSVEYVG